MVEKKDKRDKQITHNRNLEIEGTIGQILHTNHQLEQLKNRLDEILLRTNTNSSSYLYKHKGRWYKINVNVDKDDPSGSTDSGSDSDELQDEVRGCAR